MNPSVVIGIAVLAIILAIGLTRLFLAVHDGQESAEHRQAFFVPDPANTSSISVRGWSGPELDKMLGDFLKTYGLETARVQTEAKADGVRVLTFPADIQPEYFLYLVNYLRYPKGFESASLAIGILGRAKVTRAFDPPDTALLGKEAVFYVPADDKDYDLVYARVDGRTFRISFTNLKWVAVDDPRTPDAIAGL